MNKKGLMFLFAALSFAVLLISSISAFQVSGTPLENFDVNNVTGQVTYRPLNMTWLSFSSSAGTCFNDNLMGYNLMSKNFSVSLWYKPLGSCPSAVGSASIDLFSDYNSYTSSGGYSLMVRCDGNDLSLGHRSDSYGSGEQTYININNTNSWYNIILVRNNSQVNIYINNSLVYINTSFFNYNYVNAIGFSIGDDFDAGGIGTCHGNRNGGLYDDIRIYNNTINSNNVSLIYNSNRYVNFSLSSINNNLIRWYPIDGDPQYAPSFLYDLVNSINLNKSGNPSVLSWQSDNINVTTLGYPVNITLVNITNAWIVWDNGSTWNNSLNDNGAGTKTGNFTGNATFTFLNAQTMGVYENYNSVQSYTSYQANSICSNVESGMGGFFSQIPSILSILAVVIMIGLIGMIIFAITNLEFRERASEKLSDINYSNAKWIVLAIGALAILAVVVIITLSAICNIVP